MFRIVFGSKRHFVFFLLAMLVIFGVLFVGSAHAAFPNPPQAVFDLMLTHHHWEPVYAYEVRPARDFYPVLGDALIQAMYDLAQSCSYNVNRGLWRIMDYNGTDDTLYVRCDLLQNAWNGISVPPPPPTTSAGVQVVPGESVWNVYFYVTDPSIVIPCNLWVDEMDYTTNYHLIFDLSQEHPDYEHNFNDDAPAGTIGNIYPQGPCGEHNVYLDMQPWTNAGWIVRFHWVLVDEGSAGYALPTDDPNEVCTRSLDNGIRVFWYQDGNPNGVAVYQNNAAGRANILIEAFDEEISAVPALPEENALIEASGSVGLYRLTTGEFQVNAGNQVCVFGPVERRWYHYSLDASTGG